VSEEEALSDPATALYHKLMDVVIADAADAAEADPETHGSSAEHALSALVHLLADVAKAAGAPASVVIMNYARVAGVNASVRVVPIKESPKEVS